MTNGPSINSQILADFDSLGRYLGFASAARENSMTEPATPKIVTRDEWEQARAELLVREKAHTHAGDELAAARRRLPMTRMEPVMVVGRGGHVPFADVFKARRSIFHERLQADKPPS